MANLELSQEHSNGSWGCRMKIISERHVTACDCEISEARFSRSLDAMLPIVDPPSKPIDPVDDRTNAGCHSQFPFHLLDSLKNVQSSNCTHTSCERQQN